jgi:hypothetical protein
MQHLKGVVRQKLENGKNHPTSIDEIRSGVSVDVPFCEFQHETVDLLRLAWQSESLQERSQSIHEASVLEG